MAKWGEGDPRWIVEERPDSTNVNNWHWTEKNATNWSKDKIKELLTSVQIENDDYICKVKDVTKCDGEASANNRKAKLIFFYEWTITAEWEGSYKKSDNKTAYKGKIEIPNLSEENDPSEVDVNVSIEDTKQDKLKEFMRKEGAKEIQKKFELYIKLLKEEFSQGLILPTKDAIIKDKSSTNGTLSQKHGDASPTVTTGNNTLNGQKNILNTCKIETKKLTLKEDFKCRVNELYNVFTDRNMVCAFTQSSRIFYEAEKNGRFSLFDGNISGNFIELVPNQKIVMNWRFKQWPVEHYSVVTLEFTEKEDCTSLTLTQTGIPQNFVENTEEGWKKFYWQSIKQTFGFGAMLF